MTLLRLVASGLLLAPLLPLAAAAQALDATFASPTGIYSPGQVYALGPQQADATFTNAAQPNEAVRSILVQPDGGIMVAGSFTTIGGAASPGVVRLGVINVLQVAAPAAVAARIAAWPVPAHETLHIAPDASTHPLSIELLDALGRRVCSLPATGAAEVTLNTETLPASIYLLRVNYAAGAVTRRVSVQ